MKRPEQALQQAVVKFIDLAAPGLMFWHTPNSSGNRGAMLGGIMKSMGVMAGVPDLTILLPNAKTAFIELKAGRGALSGPQKLFRDEVTARGFAWAEARSVEEVEEILGRWLLPYGWTLKATVKSRKVAT